MLQHMALGHWFLTFTLTALKSLLHMPWKLYVVVRGIRERSFVTGFWDHLFLYGREFTLYTDHKTLTILNPKKERNSSLISCTIATMGIFVINIQLQDNLQIYWCSHQCGWIITFALSKGIYRFSGDKYLQHVSDWVATSNITTPYKAATWTDSVFSKVLLYSKNGWPVTFPELLKPYWTSSKSLWSGTHEGHSSKLHVVARPCPRDSRAA